MRVVPVPVRVPFGVLTQARLLPNSGARCVRCGEGPVRVPFGVLTQVPSRDCLGPTTIPCLLRVRFLFVCV